MAKTITPGNLVDLISLRFPRLLTDGAAARFADEVQSKIWYRWPWRGSLTDLPPFHLVEEEPDYGPPLLAVPADFYGLHDAWLRNSSYNVYPLTVLKDLQISSYPDIPTAISYQSERPAFRLHPRPVFTAPEWWVEGIYKKNPTKITNANINSYTLPFDDIYSEVFRQGLLWKVKKDLLGDPSWVQDLQLFLQMIDDMAVAEGLHSGVVVIHPANALDLGG